MSPRRRALALVLPGVLVAAAATAGTPAATITRHVLPNGVTVLVRESPSSEVVAMSLQVRAGSRFETAETAGATNFLHRVMARGTARLTARELAEAAEEVGGSLEASGDVESAEIRGTGLARHWTKLLDLVAGVALQPSLPSEEVERERRLILSQIQTRQDSPFQLTFDAVMQDLYGEHAYARPALGRAATVSRFSREALQTLYRETYRPDRLVLAVSGGVPAARVVSGAAPLFGRLVPAAAAAEPTTAEPAATGGRRVVERVAQQAQVFGGVLGPRLADPDYPAVKVLGAVLGGGMSGRLFVELRERRGLAYSIGALTPFRTDRGFLLAYMGTAGENVEAAEAGMRRELDRVRTDGVSDAEVARAKAYLLGNLALDRRTNARHAWYLAFFEAVGAGWEYPERYARALAAVTAAEVGAAARRYLTRPTVVVLRPSRSPGAR